MQAQSITSFQGFPIDGPLLISPNLFEDERGFFFERWNDRNWNDLLKSFGQHSKSFVQDNHSSSSKSVLRGLHYQLPPFSQGKLVSCLIGEIFDVAVDLRRHSTTFGQSGGVKLTANNHYQLWIPEGFAHGFLTLTHQADVLYKTTDFWNAESERSIRWNDPQLAISWNDSLIEPKLSKKDAAAPFFKELEKVDFFQ